MTRLWAHECPQVSVLPCEELRTVHGQSGASRHGAFTGYDAAQFGILVGECLQGLTRVRRAPHGHHHRPCGHIRGWLKLTHNAETHTHTHEWVPCICMTWTQTQLNGFIHLSHMKDSLTHSPTFPPGIIGLCALREDFQIILRFEASLGVWKELHNYNIFFFL